MSISSRCAHIVTVQVCLYVCIEDNTPFHFADDNLKSIEGSATFIMFFLHEIPVKCTQYNLTRLSLSYRPTLLFWCRNFVVLITLRILCSGMFAWPWIKTLGGRRSGRGMYCHLSGGSENKHEERLVQLLFRPRGDRANLWFDNINARYFRRPNLVCWQAFWKVVWTSST